MNGISEKDMYFSSFLSIVSADANALFTALFTPLDSGGELVFDEGELGPLQPLLEGPRDQGAARQL